MPVLDNLRKTAKRWLKALRTGDAGARARLDRAYPGAPARPTLRDVQHALAREHGHENWIALTRAADGRAAGDAPLTELLGAADRGDAGAVDRILDAHPDLIDHRGTLTGHTGLRTALHFGIEHESVVRTLLDRGADPNIRDEGDNAYPIHFAAERGDVAVVRLLIEHGADPVGAGTTHELDVLGWAVCFEYATQLHVAEYLLEHGASHTVHSAAAMGAADALRRLIRAGADPNYRMDRTNKHRTPLHLAVLKKQPTSVEALIEAGADQNLQDAVGLTPLDQAALDGEPGMVRQLVEAGAAMTLPAAIVLDRSDDVERLVREDPESLSTTDNRRWARLIVHASARASARVLEALLRVTTRHRSGLSLVNMEDDEETAVDGVRGYTPLHSAAFHGNAEAVRVLLAHGANPRVRDGKYFGTPAGWAAFAGHTAVANMILDTDVDIFDAISLDRVDRIGHILDRDPGAIDRPFKAYALVPEDGEPSPDSTPLQWAVAQHKTDAVRVLTERGAAGRSPVDRERADRIVKFLQAACWDHRVHGQRDHRLHDRAAQRMLAQDSSIASDSLYSAIVCGAIDEVKRRLASRPEAARERGGARGWTPILYLAYTRFTHPPTIENAVAIAALLLDHGADPNDFYMAGDARYSVLTGVAGEGEQRSPRQPYAAALFDVLLERGAEPFDVQVLYDTHFSGDVLWWLGLVYERTIGTERGAAWADPNWTMLDMGGYGCGARFLLETAIRTHNLRLAEWVLERGANPNAAPPRDKRLPKISLYDLALSEDMPDVANLLRRYGAVVSTREVEPFERFMAACFRLDREAARAIASDHPEYLRSSTALFRAARRDRPDVLALLLDLGTPLEVADHTGRRALHEAAYHNALQAARFLIERGAEIDPVESVYDGTPLSWASHADQREMIELLSAYSRQLWMLCFHGCVDRVRQILADNPGAAQDTDEGRTLLWSLPDDEAKAAAIAGLLIAAGVNPGAKAADGRTAVDAARQRGLLEVTARLEAATRKQA